MKVLAKILVTAGSLASPALAHAHPGHDGHDFTWSFGTGFGHPLIGWDHLLTMIAIGLWAAMLSGRARWLVPLAFVGAMTLGAAFGQTSPGLSGVDQGIAASLLMLGLLIAFAVKLPAATGMGVVGLFALFHGWAHGAEMPVANSGLAYGAGFVIATILLHVAGLGLGFSLQKRPAISRIAGGAVAAAGLLAFVA